MRKVTLTATALTLAVGLTGPAWSQETAPETGETQEQARPVRTIRVLQSPYDLASFYSARPGHPGSLRRFPTIPRTPWRASIAHATWDRRRVRALWVWAAFWAHGYRAPRPAPFVGYHRRIGENGDLFLAVPFLAPLGPLNGAFPGP